MSMGMPSNEIAMPRDSACDPATKPQTFKGGLLARLWKLSLRESCHSESAGWDLHSTGHWCGGCLVTAGGFNRNWRSAENHAAMDAPPFPAVAAKIHAERNISTASLRARPSRGRPCWAAIRAAFETRAAFWAAAQAAASAAVGVSGITRLRLVPRSSFAAAGAFKAAPGGHSGRC